MPIRIITGDAVAALGRGGITALGHQVNLRGAMGAGIARQISQAYPVVLEPYRVAVRCGELRLGGMLPVEVRPGRWIINLAAQEGVGWHHRQTDYAALAAALRLFAGFAHDRGLLAGLPYGIGCGLAGGEWGIVLPMIEQAFAKDEVRLYRISSQ